MNEQGGPIEGGEPRFVGEQGPEWFVPRQGFTVIVFDPDEDDE